jgi:hypothetical protein
MTGAISAALGGAVCGLGITLLASDLLLIPGSFVGALVAANGVLALEPRGGTRRLRAGAEPGYRPPTSVEQVERYGSSPT